MPLDLSIPSGAALVLWVEDSLTRDYLRATWGKEQRPTPFLDRHLFLNRTG
jgi:hypothetical protein